MMWAVEEMWETPMMCCNDHATPAAVCEDGEGYADLTPDHGWQD